MAMEGFAIRCPHCQSWNKWDKSPAEVALDSPNELKTILRDLRKSFSSGRGELFQHKKLFRCRSPRSICPASFEAFICRNEENAIEFAEAVESSWSFKRQFRLFRSDEQKRWSVGEKHFCGILFNTQPVQRIQHIEIETLMNPSLVSRLISGISEKVGGPVTIFTARVCRSENEVPKLYWIPLEGYCNNPKLAPPRFNYFCENTRIIEIGKMIEEFEQNNIGIDNCPLDYGRNKKCGGREEKPACLQEPKDWNRCPAFVIERNSKSACYNSDRQLIGNVADIWKKGKKIRYGLVHRCKAGFLEIAFPITVHEHLVGVAMMGQFFRNPDEIKEVKDFINSRSVGRSPEMLSWSTLEGEEKTLTEAKCILIGEEIRLAQNENSQHYSKGQALKKKVKGLRNDLDRLEEALKAHYGDSRSKVEFAFRQELLGFIENNKMKTDFFEKYVPQVLERMRSFWSFKATYLAHYSFTTKFLSTHAMSILGETKGFVYPGQKETSLNLQFQHTHPCIYLHSESEGQPSNPRLQEFLPKIKEHVVHSSGIHIDKNDYEFVVLIPSNSEIYTFIFAVRNVDEINSNLSCYSHNVSNLCQDSILATCCEVIYRFHNVHAFTEWRQQTWRKQFKHYESEIRDKVGQLGLIHELVTTETSKKENDPGVWQPPLKQMGPILEEINDLLIESEQTVVAEK